MTLVPFRTRKLCFYVLLLVVVALFVANSRFLSSSTVPGIFHSSKSHGCTLVSKVQSDGLLIRGTVLTPLGPLIDGYVLIQSGRITEIGTGKEASSRDVHSTIVDCHGSVISPGFINLHEHVAYSVVGPFKDIGERVKHRHDWRVGARNNTLREALVAEDMIGDSIKWGELRHIFSGTTSIIGGGMVTGLTRNLDFVAGLEAGLLAVPDVWDVFPLDDSDGILRSSDCDYGAEAIDNQRSSKYHRYIAHIAEGIDDEAANEFRCLSSETYDRTPMPGGGGVSSDIIAPNLAMIHALGLSEADFELVAQRGAHIVWSPRSNMFLYNKTLNIPYLLQAGVNVALGTDWLPSGSATMGREAACAALATRQLYGHVLDPEAIWEMMTINAARAAGFGEHLGSLEKGKLADVVVFSGSSNDAYSQAIFASSENIELVLRGGEILVASKSLRSITPQHCEEVDFNLSRKIVCVSRELGSTFTDFAASLAEVYPAILPGIPKDEPSCHIRN